VTGCVGCGAGLGSLCVGAGPGPGRGAGWGAGCAFPVPLLRAGTCDADESAGAGSFPAVLPTGLALSVVDGAGGAELSNTTSFVPPPLLPFTASAIATMLARPMTPATARRTPRPLPPLWRGGA